MQNVQVPQLVLHVPVDISDIMQHHVKHAVEKQIVPPVQQQQINVQNVPQIIIQMEQDVHYVQVNIVLHVMQKQERAHHVKVVII